MLLEILGVALLIWLVIFGSYLLFRIREVEAKIEELYENIFMKNTKGE